MHVWPDYGLCEGDVRESEVKDMSCSLSRCSWDPNEVHSALARPLG
jgi:hypothetical protein